MTDALHESLLTFMMVSRRLRVSAPRTTDDLNITWRHTDTICMPATKGKNTITVRTYIY
jgi:hypothetical protein